MSYAEVTARNSEQSPEEARAPPVETLVPTEPVQNLVDVDQSVNVVPSDFREQSVKTETQANRINIEKEQRELIREKAEEEKREMKKEKDKLKRQAEDKKNKAKEYAKEGKDNAKEFSQENPAIAVNLVALGLGAAVLGVFGVRKYRAGEMTWGLAGMWALGAAGVLGLDLVATKFFHARGWGSSGRD